MHVTRVIPVVNQKGGVGKTTTAMNLAACSSRTEKTLLIDWDPQGNATTGSGLDIRGYPWHAGCLFEEQAQWSYEDLVMPTAMGYDVLPSDSRLCSVLSARFETGRLTQYIRDSKNHWDVIWIDCPPSLSVLTLNAFEAASHVLIPVQCEYYALEGLGDCLHALHGFHAPFGIVRTMIDPRNKMNRMIAEQLASHFSDHIFQTCIPRNVRLAEAPSFGLSVLSYDAQCSGAKAYQELYEEITTWIKKHSP